MSRKIKGQTKHKKKSKKHVNEASEEEYNTEEISANELDDFSENDEQDLNSGDENEDDRDNDQQPRKKPKLSKKTRDRLKKKIIQWLDADDKIKLLSTKMKEFKQEKKENENNIIKMINDLGMDESKIDVHDKNENFRGRVYRYRSVTKGAIKEDIIKDALMEVIRDEKRVDQLVKKIDNKRPINERYYLKRTKGNKD